MAKGKLRHIAISVPDKEKAAKFYEETFGFERVSQSRVATRLSDGVMNITLLQFETEEDAGDERGKDFVGLHHRPLAGQCRAQVPRSIRHRLRHLDPRLGRRQELTGARRGKRGPGKRESFYDLRGAENSLRQSEGILRIIARNGTAYSGCRVHSLQRRLATRP